MIKVGRENIVFIDFSIRLRHLELREEGFLAALHDYHKAPSGKNVMKLQASSSSKEITDAFISLISRKNKPDALLFSSNPAH